MSELPRTLTDEDLAAIREIATDVLGEMLKSIRDHLGAEIAGMETRLRGEIGGANQDAPLPAPNPPPRFCPVCGPERGRPIARCYQVGHLPRPPLGPLPIQWVR